MWIVTHIGNGVYRITAATAKAAVSGGIVALVVFCLIAWTIFSNLVNIGTVFSYGPGFYVHNLLHLNKEMSMKLVENDVWIFPDKTTIAKAEAGDGAIGRLHVGEYFIAKGHYSNPAYTWIAIEGYSGPKKVHGWIFATCSNRDDFFGMDPRSKCWEHETGFNNRKDALVADEVDKKMAAVAINFLMLTNELEIEKLLENNSGSANVMVEVDSWRPFGYAGDSSKHFFIPKKRRSEFNDILSSYKSHGDEMAYQLSDVFVKN